MSSCKSLFLNLIVLLNVILNLKLNLKNISLISVCITINGATKSSLSRSRAKNGHNDPKNQV